MEFYVGYVRKNATTPGMNFYGLWKCSAIVLFFSYIERATDVNESASSNVFSADLDLTRNKSSSVLVH